jgi:hypothetical protein
VFAQACRRAPSPATDGISFREGALTGQAPEAPLDQQEADLSAQHWHISLAAHAPIMTLGADLLTMGAPGSIRHADDRDFQLALCGEVLLKHLEGGQPQRNQNTLLG